MFGLKNKVIPVRPSTGFFLLLVLFLPSQLGMHFWPTSAYIFGIRVDYLAPTIYFTDLLVVGFVACSFFEKNFQNSQNKPKLPILAAFWILYLVFNVFFVATNKEAAGYKLLKIIEFFVLGITLYSKKQLFLNKYTRLAFEIAVIYSSLIALAQFYLQKSINSFFWFLGERTFNITSSGISTFAVFGQEYLRPYATFSHPNSLAAFLFASLVFLFPWKSLFSKTSLVLGVAAIVLSFSQTVWLTLLLFTAWIIIKKHKRFLNFYKCCLLIFVLFICFLPLFLLADANFPQDIKLRLDLASATFSIWLKSPLWGVGLNNFITVLPGFLPPYQGSWFLQPVHNIFLLILSETGIVSLLLFVWFLILIYKRQNKDNFIIWSVVLTGSIDHYWLTLQQNQLLLIIVLVGSLKFHDTKKKVWYC